MEFKIDTKENYTLIHASDAVLDANMAEALAATISEPGQKGSSAFIIDLSQVPAAGMDCLDHLSALHEACYSQEKSLVFTAYNNAVSETFHQAGAADLLHLAPTLQEAIDIVSMEGLERMLGEWGDEES